MGEDYEGTGYFGICSYPRDVNSESVQHGIHLAHGFRGLIVLNLN